MKAERRRFLRLAFARLMRTVYYPLMLAVFVVGAVAASFCGGGESMPPAGICDADGSALSGKVSDTLRENGFEVCGSEDEIRRCVGSGELDCGAVILPGFEEKLRSGDTEHIVKFIYSPSSFVPKLYKNHIVAAVYEEYAPYITSASLSETDITEEEVLEAYSSAMVEGALFSFTVSEAEGTSPASSDRSLTYTLFVSSLLLFAVVMYSSCGYFDGGEGLSRRIGAAADWRGLKLPGIAARLIMFASASAVACAILALLGKETGAVLFLPLLIYSVMLTSFGIVAACVLSRGTRIGTFSFFVILCSLVLCPLYFDAALIVPLAGVVRMFLPTYWLWICVEHPAVCAAAATVSLPAAALFLRAVLGMRTGRAAD